MPGTGVASSTTTVGPTSAPWPRSITEGYKSINSNIADVYHQMVCLSGDYHVRGVEGVNPRPGDIAVYLWTEVQPCLPGKVRGEVTSEYNQLQEC